MAGSLLTGFEQVLIGLIAARPQSGYDLKQYFATTPASVYQPSSGALYPALRRLERRGLLRQSTGKSDGARRQRHVYQITAQGRAVHAAWIREPVNPARVSHDLGMHLMRFAMMERQLSQEETLAFLRCLQAALADLVAGIERYVGDGELPGRNGPLALEHGIAVFRASLDWTGRAITVIADAPAEFELPG